jgi:hypothetical protein
MPGLYRLIGVALLLAAFGVVLFRPVEPVSAAPPEEWSFEKDGAVRITRKGSSESLFLSRPKSVRVGDRSFLYGWRVNGDSAVYVPVSEIELIEEFSSVEKLKKAYRLGEPVPEKAPAGEVKIVPDKK